MLGVYPARPPAQALDLQYRRAWRAYRVIVNDVDRTKDLLVELHPTLVAFRPPGHRVHSGEAVEPANPAPFGYGMRVMDLRPELLDRRWQTWWFSGDLLGGSGSIGPAFFGRDDRSGDGLTIRLPGNWDVYSDGSASPRWEIDPDDPGVRPLSPYHTAFVWGNLTLDDGSPRAFHLECNALGAVLGGPEN